MSAPVVSPTEWLVTAVIQDLCSRQSLDRFPTVERWEVGATESGLPLISGQLAATTTEDAAARLYMLGSAHPLRLLAVDDPARISVEFAWPEPKHGEQPATQQAMVQIWHPAYDVPRERVA